MIRRDILPYWGRIIRWYWDQYHEDQPNLNVWEILERDHGIQRSRGMSQIGWSVVDFPDETAYTMFLLKWSGR